MTVLLFSKAKAYVGITSQKFENRVIQHKRPNNSCRSREIANIKDTEFKQMTDYSYPPEDCKNMESEWIDRFQTDGYTILNEKDTVEHVGSSKPKWTFGVFTEVKCLRKRRKDTMLEKSFSVRVNFHIKQCSDD